MTSLDQALIKVFAQDGRPRDREPSNELQHELYLRPAASKQDESPASPDVESFDDEETTSLSDTTQFVAGSFVVDTVVSPFVEDPVVEGPEIATETETQVEATDIELQDEDQGADEFADPDNLVSTEEVEASTSIPTSDETSDGGEASTQNPTDVTTPTRPFKAAWEVDGFRLPSPCVQMHECLQDQLHSVRSLLRDVSYNQQKLVNIHSWSKGEGRTTLAIALAHFMAKHGQNVLIIDANHDEPSLAETLGLTVDFGWEKFVSGEEALDECCVRSIQDGFSILPMINCDWSIGDLGFGQTLRSMIDSVIGDFDLVLLDTAAGRPVWNTEIDDVTAAQLVIRDVRHTSDEELQKMKRHLCQHSNQIVEVVDNFSASDNVTLKKTA